MTLWPEQTTGWYDENEETSEMTTESYKTNVYITQDFSGLQDPTQWPSGKFDMIFITKKIIIWKGFSVLSSLKNFFIKQLIYISVLAWVSSFAWVIILK